MLFRLHGFIYRKEFPALSVYLFRPYARKKGIFERHNSLGYHHMTWTHKLKTNAHSWGNVISIFLTSYYASREMSPQPFSSPFPLTYSDQTQIAFYIVQERKIFVFVLIYFVSACNVDHHSIKNHSSLSQLHFYKMAWHLLSYVSNHFLLAPCPKNEEDFWKGSLCSPAVVQYPSVT